MAQINIYVGQNIAKDSVVGDRLMDRYALFNGLERPRRIDKNLEVTILGVEAAADPTSVANAGAGNIAANWYAWKAVYASATYTRPVPVLDGSGNYTRGNPSANALALNVGGNWNVDVVVPTIVQAGITHVLLYRSLGAADQAAAEAGPFFYVGQGLNEGATVTINDNIADAGVGILVETNNFPPNAYRYAAIADSFIFAMGNFPIGDGLTCAVTPGSSVVTVDGGVLPFYDGIIGWRFKCIEDPTGGVNEGGLYFANYVNGGELQLIDGNGDPVNYSGGLSGAGQTFTVYLPGFVLRWCKKGEPESWPAENILNFEGDGSGLIQIPNRPHLLVCTDQPSMHVLDLNIIGTSAFKTNKTTVSTENTTTSHYSLCVVEGVIRAIDAVRGAIIETDGTGVRDISSPFVPEIFKYLSKDTNDIKLWHCAYDKRQEIFGAFVTMVGSHRLVNFCIGQNLQTGGWFFNSEKDLLSTGYYVHPDTQEFMVLGGAEGPGNDVGGFWGRIWTPDVYSEWLPSTGLRSGTITGIVNNQTFTVDVSTENLYTGIDGLIGRWVLICDSNGEFAQVGYISGNTADAITVDRVINGLSTNSFLPQPEAGWKFYLGLIECRWGPKKYDFGDPDIDKTVWEVWCTVHNHNEEDPPFIRLYRGYETAYAEQLSLEERINMDNTKNQSLVNKVNNKLEPVPRWAMSWYDRSYGPTTLHSLTVVFTPVQKLIS